MKNNPNVFPNNEYKELIQPLRTTSNENMLVMLEVQKENFPNLNALIKTKFPHPGSFFLPQNIKAIDDEIFLKEEIVIECLTFIDVIKNYSIAIYGDSEAYIDQVIKSIVNTRTVFNIDKVLSKGIVSDFIFINKESLYEFLHNNKTILAMYVYSLVNFITYSTR